MRLSLYANLLAIKKSNLLPIYNTEIPAKTNPSKGAFDLLEHKKFGTKLKIKIGASFHL